MSQKYARSGTLWLQDTAQRDALLRGSAPQTRTCISQAPISWSAIGVGFGEKTPERGYSKAQDVRNEFRYFVGFFLTSCAAREYAAFVVEGVAPYNYTASTPPTAPLPPRGAVFN